MLQKRIQLGLIHVAVAMTLVPINSTLNRVMIKELAISATLVAVLASLPYLFSPIQMAIGSFSDRYPLFGLRRTPYILAGLALCVAGVILSPSAAFLLDTNRPAGMALSLLTFGAWGMGYNLATVSYFSLASELSGEARRSRTIAVMFFMMIVGIILTAASLSHLLESYSPATLIRAFQAVGGTAFVLGVLGVLGLEKRGEGAPSAGWANYSWRQMFGAFAGNRQATLFFWYLLLLLTAILGQDILLEPYGAEAFGLSVQATTRITSIWGVSFLFSLVIAGLLEGRVSKFTLSRLGAWGGMVSFPLIVLSGVGAQTGVFYLGVVLLGLATGLSTVSNLSLMLDMTTASNVGLFIGAWGMASALARLAGNLMSGSVRDLVAALSQNPVVGYQVVFVLETFMLLGSLLLLRQIDVRLFQEQASTSQPSVLERGAMAGEL